MKPIKNFLTLALEALLVMLGKEWIPEYTPPAPEEPGVQFWVDECAGLSEEHLETLRHALQGTIQTVPILILFPRN